MVRQKGFTLIEMAMVFVIIGLMVGGGLVALGPTLERARLAQTNVNMDQIENALVLFVIRNNRLPCPAFGSTLVTDTVNYGVEQTNGGSPADCKTSNGVTNSVIPWRTLSLPEGYSLDAWGNRIAYFPASFELFNSISQYTSLTMSYTNPLKNCLSRLVYSTQTVVRTTGANGCDPNPNGLGTGSIGPYDTPTYPFANYIPIYSAQNVATELTGGADQSPATLITDSTVGSQNGLRAAYVLISHGKSGWYGWNKNGVQLQPPIANYYQYKIANSNGTANAAGAATFGFLQGNPIGTTSNPTAAFFDDIVRWRSASNIIQLCGNGACGNP